MKKLIIILCLFVLFGCATTKRVKQLEKRIDLLEMRAEDHESIIRVSHKLNKSEKDHLIRMFNDTRKFLRPSWKRWDYEED